MVFDPFNRFMPQDFVFKIARTPEEVEGFWALRQAIFCEEQNVFHRSDRDEFDTVAIPIVCETLIAGMEDTVVGVVRIDEREPNVWFGSRLGVASDFRSVKKISPGVALRNHQPIYRGLGALGAGLIYKAVSTAHALVCREFLAMPRMPESLEQLDLLLLTVAKARKVRNDGIHFLGLRYVDATLAAYVGESVTLRYDPRDVAEIRVFHEQQFLCRAICPELAGATIAIREIVRARNKHRRDLQATVRDRRRTVDD